MRKTVMIAAAVCAAAAMSVSVSAQNAVGNIADGASDVVEGIGDGASRIVEGIGDGASEMIDGAGDAADSITGRDSEYDRNGMINGAYDYGKDENDIAEDDEDIDDIEIQRDPDPNPATGSEPVLPALIVAAEAAASAYLCNIS